MKERSFTKSFLYPRLLKNLLATLIVSLSFASVSQAMVEIGSACACDDGSGNVSLSVTFTGWPSTGGPYDVGILYDNNTGGTSVASVTGIPANGTGMVTIPFGALTNLASPNPNIEILSIVDPATGFTVSFSITPFMLTIAAPLAITGPGDSTEGSCQTQAAINTAYTAWLAGVSTTGGCNVSITNNSAGAPPACGGASTVTFTATDDCGGSQMVTNTFTVTAPAAVSVTAPADATEAACQTQAAIDAAYTTWLAGVTSSGGCATVVTNNSTGAPLACGGSVTVTFTAGSECEADVTDMAMFTVTAPAAVSVTAPADATEAACQTQAAIDAAYTTWLAGVTSSGGCNLTVTNNSTGAPLACGGSVTVTFTGASDCEADVTDMAMFTVTAPAAVSVTAPADATEGSCQDQAAIDAAFTTWLAGVTSSGGCNLVVTPSTTTAPAACGGSVTVTFTGASDCEADVTDMAMFTVTAPAAVSVTAPADATEGSCQDQAAIDAAFTTWLAGVTSSGGCNLVVTPSTTTAPAACGGSVTVTFTGASDCEADVTDMAMFTVTAPASVSVTAPADATEGSCQTQAAIDAAFTTWLAGVTSSGGCNLVVTPSTTTAPAACGGSVTVTFTGASDCEADVTDMAMFTVTAPAAVSVTAPADATEGSCQTQAAIDAAFTTWLAGVTSSGGCNLTVTPSTTTAPAACGGSVTVTFTGASDCEADVTDMAMFTVTAPAAVSVTAPADATEGSCQTQAAIDAAFTTWLAGVTSSGGCNLTVTPSTTTAPAACGGSVTVTFTGASDCEADVTDMAMFTVTAAPAVSVTAPADATEGSCQTQAAINTAYATWLGGVTSSGGCNLVVTNNSTGAPAACGGSVTVTFTGASDCETDVTDMATFTVTAPAAVAITCAVDNTIAADMTQAAANAAFTTWLATASASGGCGVSLTNDAPAAAPDVCTGGTVTVMFTATPTSCGVVETCSADFTVPASTLDANPTGSGNVCVGTAVGLDGVPSGGTGTYTHSWSIAGTSTGAGTFSATNVQAPTFTVTSAGMIDLTYTVNDGNCMKSGTVSIFVPAMCDFEFNIDDPCVCNDDADVNADNGTFMELVAITGPNGAALPTGQTWNVTAITGAFSPSAFNEESMPGPQGAAVAPGQAFQYCDPIANPGGCLVYNSPGGTQLMAPAGSYFLVFAHVDDQGYTISVQGPDPDTDGDPVTPEPGNTVLSISNTCHYPDITILNMPSVLCTEDGAITIQGAPTTTGTGTFNGDATFAGGNPPYTYAAQAGLTDNGDGTATFDPSVAGIGVHTISYTYAGSAAVGTSAPGCFSAVEATIEVKGTLVLSGTVDDATCGTSDGEIDLTATLPGGAALVNPMYTWSDGSVTTEDRTGLAAGPYSVTVTADNACPATISFDVDEGNPSYTGLNMFVFNILCNSDDQTGINISGGTNIPTNPAHITWYGGLGGLSGTNPGDVEDTGLTATFHSEDAAPGVYTICAEIGDPACGTTTICEDVLVVEEQLVALVEAHEQCVASVSGSFDLSTLINPTGTTSNAYGGTWTVASGPASGTIVGSNLLFTEPGCYEVEYNAPTLNSPPNNAVPNCDAANVTTFVTISEGVAPSFDIAEEVCWDGNGNLELTEFLNSPAYSGTATYNWTTQNATGGLAVSITDPMTATPTIEVTGVGATGVGTIEVCLTETFAYAACGATAAANCTATVCELVTVTQTNVAVSAAWTQPAEQLCTDDLDINLTSLVTGTQDGVFTSTTNAIIGTHPNYTFDVSTAGPGVHIITYTVTSSSGCTASQSYSIEIFGAPVISGDINSTLQCATVHQGDNTVSFSFPPFFELVSRYSGGTLDLNGLLDGNATLGGEWTLVTLPPNSFPGFSNGGVAGSTLYYTDPGCYVLEYEVSSFSGADGACTDTETFFVTVGEQPAPAFDLPDEVCWDASGLPITFDILANHITSPQYINGVDFRDFVSSNASVASVNFSTGVVTINGAGTTEICMTEQIRTDLCNGGQSACDVQVCETITVTQQLNASFTLPGNPICVSDGPFALDNSTDVPTGSTWTVTMPSGNTVSVMADADGTNNTLTTGQLVLTMDDATGDATLDPLAAGLYTITHSTGTPDCQDTYTATLEVAPDAVITGDFETVLNCATTRSSTFFWNWVSPFGNVELQSHYTGNQFSLDGLLTGTTSQSGTWTLVSTPIGSVTSTNNGEVLGSTLYYTDPGCYQVRYTLSSFPGATGGCLNTEDFYIQVGEAPSATFDLPDELCHDGVNDIVLDLNSYFIESNVHDPSTRLTNYRLTINGFTFDNSNIDNVGGFFRFGDANYTLNVQGAGTATICIQERLDDFGLAGSNCGPTNEFSVCVEEYCEVLTITNSSSAADPSWTEFGPVCSDDLPTDLDALVTGTTGGVFTGQGVTGTHPNYEFDPSGLAGQTVSICYTVNSSGGCTATECHNIVVNDDISIAQNFEIPTSVCASGSNIDLTTYLLASDECQEGFEITATTNGGGGDQLQYEIVNSAGTVLFTSSVIGVPFISVSDVQQFVAPNVADTYTINVLQGGFGETITITDRCNGAALATINNASAGDSSGGLMATEICKAQYQIDWTPDAFPAEVIFSILDGSGNSVFSAGPGLSGANTTFTVDIANPAAGPFTLEVFDGFGDGSGSFTVTDVCAATAVFSGTASNGSCCSPEVELNAALGIPAGSGTGLNSTQTGVWYADLNCNGLSGTDAIVGSDIDITNLDATCFVNGVYNLDVCYAVGDEQSDLNSTIDACNERVCFTVTIHESFEAQFDLPNENCDNSKPISLTDYISFTNGQGGYVSFANLPSWASVSFNVVSGGGSINASNEYDGTGVDGLVVIEAIVTSGTCIDRVHQTIEIRPVQTFQPATHTFCAAAGNTYDMNPDVAGGSFSITPMSGGTFAGDIFTPSATADGSYEICYEITPSTGTTLCPPTCITVFIYPDVEPGLQDVTICEDDQGFDLTAMFVPGATTAGGYFTLDCGSGPVTLAGNTLYAQDLVLTTVGSGGTVSIPSNGDANDVNLPPAIYPNGSVGSSAFDPTPSWSDDNYFGSNDDDWDTGTAYPSNTGFSGSRNASWTYTLPAFNLPAGGGVFTLDYLYRGTFNSTFTISANYLDGTGTAQAISLVALSGFGTTDLNDASFALPSGTNFTVSITYNDGADWAWFAFIDDIRVNLNDVANTMIYNEDFESTPTVTPVLVGPGTAHVDAIGMAAAPPAALPAPVALNPISPVFTIQNTPVDLSVGSCTVTYTVGGLCEESASATLFIEPEATFRPETLTLCAAVGNTYDMRPTTTGGSYTIHPADGGTFAGDVFSPSTTANGLYTICYNLGNSCSDFCLDVLIKPDVDATITDLTVCEDEDHVDLTVMFTPGTTEGGNFTVDLGNGPISVGGNILGGNSGTVTVVDPASAANGTICDPAFGGLSSSTGTLPFGSWISSAAFGGDAFFFFDDDEFGNGAPACNTSATTTTVFSTDAVDISGATAVNLEYTFANITSFGNVFEVYATWGGGANSALLQGNIAGNVSTLNLDVLALAPGAAGATDLVIEFRWSDSGVWAWGFAIDDITVSADGNALYAEDFDLETQSSASVTNKIDLVPGTYTVTYSAFTTGSCSETATAILTVTESAEFMPDVMNICADGGSINLNPTHAGGTWTVTPASAGSVSGDVFTPTIGAVGLVEICYDLGSATNPCGPVCQTINVFKDSDPTLFNSEVCVDEASTFNLTTMFGPSTTPGGYFTIDCDGAGGDPAVVVSGNELTNFLGGAITVSPGSGGTANLLDPAFGGVASAFPFFSWMGTNGTNFLYFDDDEMGNGAPAVGSNVVYSTAPIDISTWTSGMISFDYQNRTSFGNLFEAYAVWNGGANSVQILSNTATVGFVNHMAAIPVGAFTATDFHIEFVFSDSEPGGDWAWGYALDNIQITASNIAGTETVYTEDFEGAYDTPVSLSLNSTLALIPFSFSSGQSCEITYHVGMPGMCEETATATLTFNDDVDPYFQNCPVDLAVGNDPSQCSAIVSWAPPVAFDNCTLMGPGSVVQTAGPASGSTFPLGSTTITYTATDTDGNTATCSFNVVVSDTEAPEFITTIPVDVTVECDAIPAPFVVTPMMHTADNCSANMDITVSYSETTIDQICANTYTIVRTWTITDEAGNTASHVQKVYVQDTTAPMVVCQDATVILGTNGMATITPADIDNGSTDNCSATGNLSYSLDVTDFDCNDVGTPQIVTLTVTDECGNAASCTATVTVVENPTIACTPTYSYMGSDPCVCKNNATNLDDGQFDELIAVTAPLGDTWTVVSSTGLYLSSSAAPPATPVAIPVGTAMTFNAADNHYELSGIHVDAVGYSVTLQSANFGTTFTFNNTCFYPTPEFTNLPLEFCLGTNVTFDVQDAFGSAGTTQYFINGNPLPGGVFDASQFGLGSYLLTATFDAGAAGNFANIGFNGGVLMNIVDNDPATPPVYVGSLADAQADAGCQSTIEVYINIVATPSVLACNSQVNLSLDENCVAVVGIDQILEGTYGCFDDYVLTLEDPSGNIIPGNLVNQSHIGMNLTAIVTDPASGNSCWGMLLIEDKLQPEFDCPADITVKCSDDTAPLLTGQPVVTSCEISTTITHNDVFTDFGQCADPRAEIIRTWTVTDESGNSSTCVQTITIAAIDLADVTFPADLDDVTLPALECSDVAANPLLTSSTNTGMPMINGLPITNSGLCMASINVNDEIYDICEGSYEIVRTWKVRNMCLPIGPNNPVEHSQVIKVLDSQGPSITPPADITFAAGATTCSANVNVPAATITDGCSSYDVVTITPFGTLSSNGGFVPQALDTGTYTITYVATDGCGNTSVETMKVTVEDQTTPTAVCDLHTVASIGTSGIATIFADAFDDGSYDNCTDVTIDVRKMTDICNIAGNLNFGPSVSFCCEEVGTTIMVEMRVTDGNGLTNSCMVEVEVQDKEDPVIICKPDFTVGCDTDYLADIVVGQPLPASALAATGTPIVIDNCGATLASNVILSTVDNCGMGEIKIAWSATDGSGNFDGCFQSIFINDTNPFNGNSIVWPQDYEANTCGLGLEPEDLPTANAYPTYDDGTCSNVAMTHDDTVLEFGAADACLKILRKWIIIDWCTVPAGADPTDPNTPGVWHYTQLIKVVNSTAPVIETFNGATTIDNFDANCGGVFVAFDITASDDCTAQSDLEFSWEFSTGTSGTGQSASAVFVNGTYSVTFTVNDQCGNVSTDSRTFTVADKKKPTPVCIFGIATTVMPSAGAVTIWASDFESGSSYDNCTAYNDLIFSFSPVVPGQTIEDNITIACADIPASGLYPITLYVTDAAGNSDFCSTFIDVQDPNNICINGPQVAGVIETEFEEAVEEVTVTLSDDGGLNIPVITGADGTYQFNMNFGNYDVSPEKDINYMNGVSTIDIARIQQHILGLNIFDSPYKWIAADVNNSGTVTGLDMVKIRRLILLWDTEFADNNSWRFVDMNYVFQNPLNPLLEDFPEVVELSGINPAPADFIGVKIGDVNGSASPNSLLGTETRSFDGKLAFQLDANRVPEGEEFTVDFRAKDFKSILGYQFTLGYDNSKVEYLDVATKLVDLSAENFGLTKLEEGAITTSWNESKGITLEDNEVLFSITFKALEAINTADIFHIENRYTAAEAYKGDDLLDVVLEFNGNEVASNFELYQNTPNPFNLETAIGFNMPQAETVTLKIYDVSGRVLKLMTIDATKGYNSVNVKRADLDGVGVLYYQLETTTDTETKKLIILD